MSSTRSSRAESSDDSDDDREPRPVPARAPRKSYLVAGWPCEDTLDLLDKRHGRMGDFSQVVTSYAQIARETGRGAASISKAIRAFHKGEHKSGMPDRQLA